MQKSIGEPQVIYFDIVITSYSLQLKWSYDHNAKLHGSGNSSKSIAELDDDLQILWYWFGC